MTVKIAALFLLSVSPAFAKGGDFVGDGGRVKACFQTASLAQASCDAQPVEEDGRFCCNVAAAESEEQSPGFPLDTR